MIIERIRITVLTITCMCVFSDQNHAGVIVENNIVTKATLNNGTTDFNVQFVNASYNTLNATNSQAIMPWFTDAILAQKLAEDLRDTINIYELGAPQLDTFTLYLFTYGRNSGNQRPESWLVSDADPWSTTTLSTDPDEELFSTSFPYYYAILDTGGNSSVPEPSTAIAMGLLGIVGFAGNRRRRRQESVA